MPNYDPAIDISALFQVNMLDNNDGTVTISLFFQNNPEPAIAIIPTSLRDWFGDLTQLVSVSDMEKLASAQGMTIVPDSVD